MSVTCKRVGVYKKATLLIKIGRESGHSQGVKALAIESELGTESKESQIITAGDL
jgi:hypothetical protein